MDDISKAKQYLNTIKQKLSQNTKLPIIIDSDPGIDDALALLFLHDHIDRFDVLMLSSCAGNTPIDITTTNLMFFAENFFDTTIVAKGSKMPLVKIPETDAANVHGKSGMGDFIVGEPEYEVEPDAVECITETLMHAESPITIVALGPLTNIAKVLINNPQVKDKIKAIHTMIGSINGTGNVTTYAEFNSYFDPEAFDIVVKSDIPLVVNPMQTGAITKIKKEVFLKMPEQTMKDKMVKTLASSIYEPSDNTSICIYDIHTIVSLVKPELYDFVPCDIQVFTQEGLDGKTIFTTNENGMHTYIKPKDIEVLNKYILTSLFKD